MVEKLKGYRVGDQVYPTLVEAERAEGRQELWSWLKSHAMGPDGRTTDADEVEIERIVTATMKGIEREPDRFVALLRKAGVRRKGTKRKPPSHQQVRGILADDGAKKAAKAAAE